jgi:hypothetical protein
MPVDVERSLASRSEEVDSTHGPVCFLNFSKIFEDPDEVKQHPFDDGLGSSRARPTWPFFQI